MTMTSFERVLTALGHKEPDRVPVFLFPTMHGAKELGLSIRKYFSKPENVVRGQIIIREKYRNDCASSFFYGPIEVEAWGGEVIWSEDGPPNSGEPIIRSLSEIRNLEVPKVKEIPCLVKVLEAAKMLKQEIQDDAPIIGVAISPFSLPVMQMGFNRYIELMYDDFQLFNHLMKINEEFCVQWANAQLEAGAAAICYFDPLSSPTITTREMYMKTGFEIARRTISRIKGPAASHMASGRCLPIINELAETGTAAVGVSCLEDLGEIKAACKGKLAVIGSLNGIEMARWTPDHAEKMVKEAIAKAGKGGGFILSDNHGEIPFQVSDEVLLAISEAVHKWGNYPLNWIEDNGK